MTNNFGRKSIGQRLKTIFLSRPRKYGQLGETKFEIQQTRTLLRSVLQNSSDIIFVADLNGFLVSFNRGGEEVLGYEWQEIAGKPVSALAQDPEAFHKLFELSDQDGRAAATDFPFLHKTGQDVYCDISLANLKNADNQSIGTVGICRDVTSRKSLQEDLIRIDRLAEMGRIAAGVAHEINNPLAVINEAAGWGSVVTADAEGIKQEDKEELEKIFKDIVEQTKRCRSRTKQVLGFARDSEPTKKQFDIHELIRETVEFLDPELKYKQIDIVYEFADGPLILKSDPKQLEQVFVNLLTNAIYAIKEKGEGRGTIKLETSLSESEAQIQVSDSGTGMSEEVQKKIFDLFYTTKPRGKGTGLGLAICGNIIKKLSGEMRCRSLQGQGTTFSIRIPLG
ncbi:MAG: ATP-binding protein [Desulfatiglandaceae bacterium]|jgi:PAS domain S-box-containing protein